LRKTIRYILLAAGSMLFGNKLFAQAPILSYATPQVYITGNAITSLSPTNTGGAVPATTYGQVSTFVAAASGLNNPRGIASDGAGGNIYVTDFTANIVYKINSSGTKTVLAGSGAAGENNATGALATFNGPSGIVYDGSANLYVADYTGNKIRKIVISTGVVTTIAGSGSAAETQGTGTAAAFNNPYAIATDGTNLYVTDYTGNTVRKIIISTTVVSSLAGSGTNAETNGTGATAAFKSPAGIVYSASELYVNDAGGNTVRKIATSNGAVTTIVSSGLTTPQGITIDAVSGNLVIADEGDNLIKTCTIAGASLTTLAGSGTQADVDGVTTAAQFYSPYAVQADGQGHVFTGDDNGTNSTIRKIILTGYTISPALPAGLSFDVTTGIISGTPTAVTSATTYTITGYNSSGSNATTVSITTATPPSLSYTTSTYTYDINHAITALTPTNSGGAVPATVYATVSLFAGSSTGGGGSTNGVNTSSKFTGPTGITVNSSGTMFVADKGNNMIRKISGGSTSTLGGTTTAGHANGTGVAATFNAPREITTDPSGNLYVADLSNNEIRKIVASTAVTTLLAGSVSIGSGLTNGTGSAALFHSPSGAVYDPVSGTVYIADRANNEIRQVTTGGVVTLFAGSATGASGNTNGTGSGASFSGPTSVGVDASGNVYVADKTNNLVRKITPAGVVTTLAGSGAASSLDGTGTAATFNAPGGITVDPSGNIYVSEVTGNKIRMITPAGVVTTVAGSGTAGRAAGVGTAATFSAPAGMAIDPTTGYIMVADSTNNEIRQIIGTGYTISPTLPTGLTFDSTTGTISGTPTVATAATVYTITGFNVAGSSSAQVTITTKLFAPAISYAGPQSYKVSTAITTLNPTNTGGAVPANAYGTVSLFAGSTTAVSGTGTGTGTTARFTTPTGITIDASGNMYVADKGNNAIRKLTSGAVETTFAGVSSTGSHGNANGTGAAANTFFNPSDVTLDASGNLYVADLGNNEARQIIISSVTGSLLAGSASGTAGHANGTGSAATFSSPSGSVYDPVSGTIYIADQGSNQIRQVTTGGVVTLFAGDAGGATGNTNGTGSGASFSAPTGIDVDASGNVYVADKTNNLVRKITPAGVVTTLAGSGTASSVDGTGTAATFNAPDGLAVDPSGNVYVSEATGNKIRMITPAGVVTTVAGSGTAGLANGVGTAATFSAPAGLGIDPTTGNIMVADATNNEIRQIIGTGYTISPALPTGLSFSSTTGAISGTPSVSSPATTYTITAFNTAGSSTATVTITCYVQHIWTGGTSNVWSLATNWSGSSPPTLSSDQVVIGATTTFTNAPLISGNTSIGSILMGTLGGRAPGITVNSPDALTISGDITYESNNVTTGTTAYTATLAGTGTINANNLNVTLATGTSTAAYNETFGSGVTNLNLSGNLSLTSSHTTGTQNALFNLTGGTMTVDSIMTSNANATNTSTIAIGNSTALQLMGMSAFNGLSSTGTNTITFGTGVTIGYTGNKAQTVYTDAAIPNSSLTTGISYTNLALSGTGIKTALTGNLNISGNFTNTLANDAGDYANLSTPTVNFTGSSAQTLAGGSGNGTQFKNVTFSGGGTKTMSSGGFSVASAGLLTMSGSSALAAGGFLTLKSDTTGSATVAVIPTGSSITGSVNVQRFVTGGNLNERGFRLMSSPVSDPASSPANAYYNLSYLAGTGSLLTGSGGATNGFDAATGPTTAAALYLYRDDITPDNSSFTVGNFRAVTKINNTNLYSIGTIDGSNYNLPVGAGYAYFFRGNTGTLTTTVPSNITFSATGVLNQGQITYKFWPTGTGGLDFTAATGNSTVEGFNLVGNPYASSIDWHTIFGNNSTTTGICCTTNTDQTVYIFNPVLKVYATYLNTSATTGTPNNGGSNIIPAGQGFFVHTTVNGTPFYFNESAKVSTQPGTLLLNAGNSAPDQHIHLELVKDSVNREETTFIFNGAANTDYVPGEDALYLRGTGGVSLANIASNNRALAISQLPFSAQNQTIPLYVSVTSAGPYQFNLTDITLAPVFDVWLKDALLKDSVDIKNNPTYSFTVPADTTGTGNRFSLVISPDPTLAVQLLSFTGAKETGDVKLVWTAKNEANYTQYTLQRSTDGGKTFITLDSLTSASLGTYTDLDTKPATGQNQYRLKQVDINGVISYSSVVTIMYSPLSNNIGANIITVYPNPASTTLNLVIKTDATTNASASYKITITSSAGIIVKTVTSAQPNWQDDVSGLYPGTYFVQVTNAKDNTIIGSSTFIKL